MSHEMPGDDLPEGFLETVLSPATSMTWGRLAAGAHRLPLDDWEVFLGLAPTQRLLNMLLLLSLKDRATSLAFTPTPFDASLREYIEPTLVTGEVGMMLSYVVDGVTYPLVPPPASLKDILTSEIQHIAGLVGPRRWVGDRLRRLAARIDHQPPLPRSGRVVLELAGQAVVAAVLEYPSQHGPRFVFQFQPQPDSLADSAQQALRVLFQVRSREASQG